MPILETLANIIPDINISLNTGDDINYETTNNTVIIVDEGKGEVLERGDERDIIDIGHLDEEQREQFQTGLVDEWESVEELFRDSTANDKAAIEEGLDDEQIQDTLAYFRPILPEHYYLTLEAALHFRKQIEMVNSVSSDWVRQRRKDIAEKYDGETYQVINLCSAGYFDEGRYLRQLYEGMSSAEDYREGDYKTAFEEIVTQRPFTVFVSGGQTAPGVAEEIRQKVEERQRYDVRISFIDVRGMGASNREKISDAVEILAEELGDFQVNQMGDEPELVIRIDPSTVDLP